MDRPANHGQRTNRGGMMNEIKPHYFDDDVAPQGDIHLQMAIHQGYVPATCLLGGFVVMAEVKEGRDPCDGCGGPRERCRGRRTEA